MKISFVAICRWVSIRVLSFLLILLPVSFYFQTVLSNPEKVKSIIQETGAYEKIVPTFVDQSVQQMAGQYVDASQLPLNDPRIAEIFKSSISAQDMEKYSESAIDSFYTFANSDASNYSGQIDYSASKDNIVDGLVAYAAERLKSAPECTLQQTQILQSSFNAFNAPCRPYGTNVDQLASQLKQQLSSGDSQLAKSKLDLGTTPLGQEASKNSTTVQNIYGLISLAFWINITLVIITIAVLSALKLRKGLYVGAFLQSAIALVVFAGISLLLFSKNPSNVILAQNQLGKDVVLPISYGFLSTLAHIELIFAGIYAAIALGIFVYVRKVLKGAKAAKNQPTQPTLDDRAR